MSTQVDPFLDLGFQESSPDSLDPFTQLGFMEEEGEPSFLQKVSKAPQAVRSAIQRGREAIKGVIKKGGVGVATRLGGTYGDIIQMLGPSEDISRAIRHTPMIPIPTSQEVQNLMETLGIETEPENVAERFAQRIGEAAGTGAAFGGTGIPALATGAVAGQAARELGAPELLSSLIDIGATFGKGAIQRKLLPRGKEAKRLVEAGRKVGLTEKEISPLVKGPKKFAFGKMFTRKADKMEKLTSSIQSKLGDSYKFIKEAAKKEGRVPFKDSIKLSKTLSSELKKLSKTHSPSDAKKKAMEILDKTLTDIHLRGSSYEKLINTYQDINKEPAAVRKILEPIKKIFTSELKKGAPELAKDFENVNQLYSRFADRIGKLKPGTWDKLFDKAEAWGIPAGIIGAMMGKPWLLGSVLSKTAVRSLGQAYLTEPFLQNIPNKFLQSIKTNKKETALKLIASFKKFVKKKYDEDLDEEEKD